MKNPKRKRQLIGSSAALISLIVHIILLSLAGGIVALRYFNKTPATFEVTEQKKLERRQLDIPVQVEPFMQQMSKPARKTTSRITANAPQMVNIPQQGTYVEMAPMPTFKSSYTNFIQTDRTMIMKSKYRETGYGLSAVDFFGTRGKAEKVLLIVDASPAMVSEDRGGLFAYQTLNEELRLIVDNFRSSTLFNLILHDHDHVAHYQPALVPATAHHKTNLLDWVASINTNVAQLGLNKTEATSIIPTGNYELPVTQTDMTGWLKSAQLATTMQPEIIFFLSGDWGSITDPDTDLSYFARKNKLNQYLDQRLETLLSDEDVAEEWEEMSLELEELVPVAEKMLELENQARFDELLDPKIVAYADEILWENDVDIPDWILLEEPEEVGIYPADTRYTFEEIMQTLFVFTMEIYQERGFPEMNFVLLEKGGSSLNNSAETASLLTSTEKYELLTDMLDARFRIIDAEDPIDNVLDQNIYDIMDMLEEEAEEELL
tara:strand:- start:10850 stop:12322 length:1473 start_codon:yes stop_codon:yes gene_type:complete